jgi:hypothetical protein
MSTTVGGYVVVGYAAGRWALRVRWSGETVGVYATQAEEVAAAERYERLTASLDGGS